MKTSKILSSAIALSLAASCVLTGCGGKTEEEKNSSSEAQKADSKQEIQTSDDGSISEELTALELAKKMGNGINLGNTMEAYGHGSFAPDSETRQFETLWGQPVTTQEMIDGMKAAGFDSLRIPIAWTNAMDYESGDYTISETYLDRVEEIINYGLNADMYVIINDHWDGGWWGMFGSASEETRTKAMDMYTSMWTQIAERYGDYSDKLIFESANEELGDRLNDKDIASDSGTLSQNECYEKTNEINQTFVDLIRSTGGNNAQRFLLIAGYNTDIMMTCDDRFKMPTDSAKDKLLLSVHYYTPWDYCGMDNVLHWGSVADYDEQNQLFEMLTKFTDKGYGVVIGEYAVLAKGSTPKTDTDKFTSNLLNNCDLYGYVPMLWDCNGLYQKTTAKILDETIADIFQSASLSNDEGLSDEEVQSQARAAMDAAIAAAQEELDKIVAIPADENTAVAWIMYQSSDYAIYYSVGDNYDPTNMTDGIIANNVEITGEGEYTVSLDLSDAGIANGIAFSALGIANGETLFPNHIINIEEILINDSPIELTADDYTCSDDGICTRVNLYNQWVSSPPDNPRMKDGDPSNASAQIVDIDDSLKISTITITFTFSPAA